MSARTVRIASYNLLHGLDLAQRGAVDLDAAAAVIAELDADVVALQEVDRGQSRSGRADQVAELAARLDRHGAFAPALLGSPDRSWRPATDDDGGPAYGVGLLSRTPLQAVAHRHLPGGGAGARTHEASLRNPGWDREPRVALSAQVPLAEHPITVTVTHLSYLPWRAVRQLRVAADHDPAVADGAPHVLVGDLNLPPTVVRMATRRWLHAGGAAQFPSWRPRLQIHHVLLRGDVGVEDVRVHDRSTSDHRPLVADLRVCPAA